MTDAKAHEKAACAFFEALLKLEYPGRRVAVTPAPFFDEVPEDTVAQLDGSGVVDVTVGPLEHDPAWVCFRCVLQFEVTQRDWPEAARVLLERVRLAFGCSRMGSEAPPALDGIDRGLLKILQEVARRANWDAKHGPQHLRTGRFVPEAIDPEKKPGGG